ncbi:MAG TPA: hypothetical protein PL033_07060 [Candidatus Brocadiia bacterium]|nr:hypothetical protein [Candidatus Brocadiia bacterium]
MKAESVLAKAALSQLPRILGLGDRRKGSRTWGCFDRHYWHYRLHDWSNARYQEAAWLMALAYSSPMPENRWRGLPALRQWALAAVDFWAKSQNRDGSFNEVYPRERGFCATAFSAYCVCETLLLLKVDPPPQVARTAKWLADHDNPAVANQRAASCAALMSASALMSAPRFRAIAEDRMELLLKDYRANGYFPEYGGFDIGYTTVTLSCLAGYLTRSPSEGVQEVCAQAVGQLEPQIAPNGQFDYSRASRKTQYVYPRAFARMRSPVIDRIAAGVDEDLISSPAWMDDRYVIPLATDYLLAALELGG